MRRVNLTKKSKIIVSSVLIAAVAVSSFLIIFYSALGRNETSNLPIGGLDDELLIADSKVKQEDVGKGTNCMGKYVISDQKLRKLEKRIWDLARLSFKSPIVEEHTYLIGEEGNGYFRVSDGFFSINNILADAFIDIQRGSFLIIRNSYYYNVHFAENNQWALSGPTEGDFVIFYPKYTDQFNVFLIDLNHFHIANASNFGQFDYYYDSEYVEFATSDLDTNTIIKLSDEIWNFIISTPIPDYVNYPFKFPGRPYLKNGGGASYNPQTGILTYYEYGYFKTFNEDLNQILGNYGLEMEPNQYMILETGSYYYPYYILQGYSVSDPLNKNYAYSGILGPYLGATVLFRPRDAPAGEIYVVGKNIFDVTEADKGYFDGSSFLPNPDYQEIEIIECM